MPLLATAQTAFGQVSQHIVAATGDAAPGGGRYGDLSGFRYAINDSGQVAFWATLVDTDAQSAILRSDEASTFEIARNVQQAPGGPGTFSEFAGPLYLNNAGQAAFATSPGRNVYRGDGATPVVRVASSLIYDRYGFNALGQAATYTGETIKRGNGQSATTIVNVGQQTPGGAGTFYGVFGAWMNDAGRVSFFATITDAPGGNEENEGLYHGDGTTLVEVTREGRATPSGVGVYASLLHGQINNAGRTAFGALLRGTNTASDWGLFAVDADGTAHELARTGQAAPGGGSLVYASAHLNSYSHNNAGQMAFTAAISSSVGGNPQQHGLFVSDNGALTEVVRSGSLTPDPTRRFTGIGAGSMAFNDVGDIAFLASIARSDATVWNVPPDTRSALYLYTEGALVEVARTGDPLLGSTINFLTVAPTVGSIGDESSGLNDQGQLAYYARLADGRSVLLMATAVPEPTGIAVVGISAAATLLVRRRRKS
ncbi:MAG TPA: choice-of-anchor tandem repeat NxxGxxAF-containing protein [Tepidisphaeraceae bacterium]|jgi:hypothetical protein|nr:choice-of-anchor tandem repeat NxxGxxAF-containing protein [Tepidisphaeraceae bacterium]